MRRLISTFFIVCCVAVLPSTSHGQLAITASDVTVDAGTTATVDFFISDLDGSVGSLFGATFGVDYGNNESDTLPAGLATTAFTPAGLFVSTASSPAPVGVGANYNVQVDFFNIPGLGVPVTITDTPQLVFSVDFEVGGDVADGTVFEIDILGSGETSPNDIFTATDGDVAEVPNVVTGLGTITVVNDAAAVPEPTAGVLLLICGGVVAARRRR